MRPRQPERHSGGDGAGSRSQKTGKSSEEDLDHNQFCALINFDGWGCDLGCTLLFLSSNCWERIRLHVQVLQAHGCPGAPYRCATLEGSAIDLILAFPLFPAGISTS